MDSDEFLAHYGIRGMKWGVKKQLPTSSSNNKTSNSSTSEERLARNKKIRNIAIGAAAVTALGIATYAYAKYDRGQYWRAKNFIDGNSSYTMKLKDLLKDEQGDRIISKGSEFFRRSTSNETHIIGRTYAMLGKETTSQTQYGKNLIKIKAIGDIRMPSYDTKLKIATDLFADKTRQDLHKRISKGSISARIVISRTGKEKLGSISLMDMMADQWTGDKANTFRKTLQDLGYSAVSDDNQRGAATVLFDNARVLFNN